MALAHPSAAVITEVSVKISFRFFPISLIPAVMVFILFWESPNPILNPFLNIAANSLLRFNKADIFLSVLSITVSPCVKFPKSTPVPLTPVPLPVDGVELSVSVWLSSLLIWSKPMRVRIFSAAFLADLATPLLALERLSAELAASSIPALAPAAALPIAEICPEALLLDF